MMLAAEQGATILLRDRRGREAALMRWRRLSPSSSGSVDGKALPNAGITPESWTAGHLLDGRFRCPPSHHPGQSIAGEIDCFHKALY